MTKKHFIVIASILSEAKHYMEAEEYNKLVNEFIERIGVFNPLFDKDKFLVACGVKGKSQKGEKMLLEPCWCGSTQVHTHE
jgi:hypothetical protein